VTVVVVTVVDLVELQPARTTRTSTEVMTAGRTRPELVIARG
jgi:hypothetical protein